MWWKRKISFTGGAIRKCWSSFSMEGGNDQSWTNHGEAVVELGWRDRTGRTSYRISCLCYLPIERTLLLWRRSWGNCKRKLVVERCSRTCSNEEPGRKSLKSVSFQRFLERWSSKLCPIPDVWVKEQNLMRYFSHEDSTVWFAGGCGDVRTRLQEEAMMLSSFGKSCWGSAGMEM